MSASIATASPSHPAAVNFALVLKIVIPLIATAALCLVGLVVWLCRTPDYDANASVILRRRRAEEDPAPAYDREAGPPIYLMPLNMQQDEGAGDGNSAAAGLAGRSASPKSAEDEAAAGAARLEGGRRA